MATIDPDRVGIADMAGILGISQPHLRSLTAQGVFKNTARGKYQLGETVRAWIEWVRKGQKGALSTATRQGTEAEKLRKLRLENDERERMVAPIADLRIALHEVFEMLATEHDALPKRISDELAGLGDARLVRARLSDELTRMRVAAADRLASFGLDPRGGADIPTAAEANAGRMGGPEPDAAAVEP